MADRDDWKIPAPSERCQACEVALPAGAMVTAVLELEPEQPRRQDYCEACGESVEKPPRSFSWRHRRAEQGDSRPVVDYALLREVFEGLLDRTDALSRRLSYLIGLVLVRKRHLRLKGFERRDGAEIMVVSRGAGEPELIVPAPHLSAEDLLSTRNELMKLMTADLPEEDLSDAPGSAKAEADDPPSPAAGAESEASEASEAEVPVAEGGDEEPAAS
ncbi:MAG: hypothetical protein DHS20C15_20840 [Planctomycetota bacterium]|nr:MAG: hypothetical protein DHS20C15_20840 [Planctomycetota bacterium]